MGSAVATEFSYLKFGAPPDRVAWIAFALGVVTLAVAVSPRRCRQILAAPFFASPRRTLALLAVAAAMLSALYVSYYLRGGARIIDATSYLLQARTFAEGQLAFDVPWPSASFRGRFLTGPTSSSHLAVIFPPGYPAVLAIGAWLGHPMLIGPFFAAGLVVATFALTIKLFGQIRVALLAALCSTLCAALRYHTADTMSHGLAALLVCCTLLGASSKSAWGSVLAGFSAGLLCATRPVSGMVSVLSALWLMNSYKTAAPFIVATIPGLLFLFSHQLAATGHAFESAQQQYYDLSDGPPGCFRYGFGSAIGCLFEHGDYVKDVLPHGFGLFEALRVSGRRLFVHLQDVANLELLVAPIAYVIWKDRRVVGVRICVGIVVFMMLAYAPFYFDGSYPGGGARLFADILPLEHALLAWALYRLRIPQLAAPCMLLGFGLHTGYGHRALSNREGGRPMFDDQVLSQVGRGLLFVGSDHGFNMAFDPNAVKPLLTSNTVRLREPLQNVVVARTRGDAHDRLLWERLGRPPVFRYEFEPLEERAQPHLSRIDLTKVSVQLFEAEAMWPPIDKRHGYLFPAHAAQSCVSKGRGLQVHLSPLADGGAGASWSAELSVLESGSYRLSTQWLVTEPLSVTLRLANTRATTTLTPATDRAGKATPTCVRSIPFKVPLQAGPHLVTLDVKLARSGSALPKSLFLLDSFRLHRDRSGPGSPLPL